MKPAFAELSKNKIAWYKTGQGKALVILHGWGSNSAVMMPVAEQLTKIRTTYMMDFPGFGHSPEPEQSWGVGDYADAAEEFMNTILPDEKFDLLVHSYGGRVALKLLTREKIASRIDKVVFIGAAGLKPKRKFSFYLKKYTAKTLKLPFYILPKPLREKGLNRLRKSGLWKNLGSSEYQVLSGVMRETFVKSVTEYLDSLLPEIQHEVLLIWGKNDTSTPINEARSMEKGIKNSALIILDDAGHYPFLDKPSQFSAILKAYLEPNS